MPSPVRPKWGQALPCGHRNGAQDAPKRRPPPPDRPTRRSESIFSTPGKHNWLIRLDPALLALNPLPPSPIPLVLDLSLIRTCIRIAAHPMSFLVNSRLEYTLQSPASFLFSLKCIETGGQRIINESLVTNPYVDIEEFSITGGMNRFSRIKTWNPGELHLSYQALIDTSHQLIPIGSLLPDEPGTLKPEAIPFLFPSRYCQSDLVRQDAFNLFGHLATPYGVASNISDWIHENISYVSGSTAESCSAIDVLNSRQGVCRDFAHLGITLCRAMSIPARYATCYAHQLNPPDFHAVFEAYIDGWWLVFDPTRLAPLNGLVRIATGRDAADAAVCTIFGNPELKSSYVSCQSDDPNFQAVTRDTLVNGSNAFALL